MVSAPKIRAYCNARCPSPPMPKMAARSVGRSPETLTALYVVTPAQVSGAASSELTVAGTRTTWSAWASAYSACAPSTP
jgi:hypothetical protein